MTDKNSGSLMDTNRLLDERAAADTLNVSPRTLQHWRMNGAGPAFVRVGMRRVGYRLADLEAWMAAATFKSRAAELAKTAA